MKFRCSTTWAILWIAAFLIVGIADCKGLLCNKGLKIMNGEYYRVFTGLLLHVNWFHLLFNVVSVYFVCEYLEKIAGLSFLKLLVFSALVGTVANFIFSAIYTESTSVGGSPVVFALIGLICVLQICCRDLPRFQLGTWYGNWTLAVAILGNIPIFSGNISTLVVHGISFLIAVVLGLIATGLKLF